MWIALEGIDGAGKRTQASFLKERIERNGLTAAMLSFPRYGETIFSRSIADYLNGHMGELHTIDPHLPALLYAGDRLESRDLLQQIGTTVDVLILDRYTASNCAYQAARLPAEERWRFINWITEIEHGAYRLPHANHTVLLDVPVETSARLVAQKDQRTYTDRPADIHEQDLRYLSACREVYLMLADAQHGGPWTTVRCVSDFGQLLSIEAIHASIWQALVPLLQQQAGRALCASYA